MHPSLPLAQYVVNHAQQYGPVTPLKLQKLLYYVKAWSTVAERDLVPFRFERWDYGPVNPDVYRAYKPYGRQSIPFQEIPAGTGPEGEQKMLIDFITTCYAQHDALDLSAMTHREDPWRKTPRNAVISEALMKAYYARQRFAKNFPFDPDQPFYPVESDAEHATTMDMSKREAERLTTYASYWAYVASVERATKHFEHWRDRLLA